MRENLPALRQLALLVRPGGLLVEVGSFAGESTKVFLEVGLHVHAIDPWDNSARDRLLEGSRDHDSNHRWRFDMSDAERQFDELLSRFPDRLTKQKGYDWQFADEYAPGSLDAVYLDAVHTYDDTLAAIGRWCPKIKAGGLLCGHDYADTFPGVVQAVNEALNCPPRVFGDSSWCGRY
jgi:hypothetical protein